MANKLHNPAVYGLLALVLACCTNLEATPVASFFATPTSGCNPLKVDFINHSTGGVKYLWKLGNGNSSSLVSPSAVYNKPGKYSVSLIVVDAAGLEDTLELVDYITVFQSPVADFIADKRGICAGDSVLFTDNSSPGDGTLVGYKWDFGNGQLGRESALRCRYSQAGSYDVALAVVDANGCSSIQKVADYIAVSKLPVIQLLSSNRYQCQAPALVDLNANIQGTGPFAYRWAFGDGDTSTEAQPVHGFQTKGKYDVSLAIVDGLGCKNAAFEKDFIAIDLPSVDFKSDKTGMCENSSVTFTNNSSPRNGKGWFHWDFGNGDTSNIENPNWKYAKAGIYDVKLTYHWEQCVVSVTKPALLDVKPAPIGFISLRDTMICRAKAGDLLLKTVGSNYNKIEWSMVDGSSLVSSTPANGVFRFPADTSNGSYKIKAVFYSPYACGQVEDEITITVRGPHADLCLSKKSGCLPYNGTATFCGSSSAPIATYSWQGFGKSYPSNASNIAYTNSKFGLTAVGLTVTDINGCSDSRSALIGAGIPVDADFTLDKKIICNNETLTLYNHSKQQNPDTVAFFYSWFNKDTIPLAYGDSVKIKFRTDPSPNVKVTVTASSYGCAARTGMNVEVLGPLVAGAIHAYCDKDTFRGLNNSTDFTKTYWKYTNGAGKVVVDPNVSLVKKLEDIQNPWIYAENSKNHCTDSLQLELNIDPQVAAFSYELKCGSGLLKAKNLYQGLKDTMFTWTLVHIPTGNISTYRTRDLQLNLQSSGSYQLTLNASNKKYLCTKPQVVTFYISPAVDNKPQVKIDRQTCYPVKLDLIDPLYQEWTSASWQVGPTSKYGDSVQIVHLDYLSNEKKLQVFHHKTDKQGCTYTDSFLFDIGGFTAAISMSQDNTNCLSPVCSFAAQNNNATAGAKYGYDWNFGYKQSNSQTDTVQLHGSGVVISELTIRDTKGCASRETRVFMIKVGKPKARFVVASDTLESCPPLQVQFADSSTSEYGPITMRRWSFGDGSHSEKTLPGKLYVVPGKYPVSIEVANNSGCRDTFEIPDLVVVKGPVGTYAIDRWTGCAPFLVNLNSSASTNVTKFDFDMGDGNVVNEPGKNHMYTKPGKYIPRLILTDSSGCKYSPFPKDTIEVYALPKVQLSGGAICENQVLDIMPSTISVDPIDHIEWFMGSKKVGSSNPYQLKFTGEKQYNLTARATTSHGCADTALAHFRVFSLNAQLGKSKDGFCLGESILLADKSDADTTIISRKLWVANDEIAISKSPYLYTANKRGSLPVAYTVVDALGCVDTFREQDWLKVGDTIAPETLTIYRSTVRDNFSTETSFKPSVEPDYNGHALYVFKNGYWQKVGSGKTQLDTTMIAVGLNTLNQSYCHIIRQTNYCGKVSDTVKIQPHCTIETKAVGDTNVSRVSWSPYSGWEKLEKYRIWRKQKEQNEFLLLDSVDGSTLHYVDSTVFCNIEYDYRIEGVEHGLVSHNSFSDTARSKPLHFSPVPAPELWRTTVDNNAFTHTEWVMCEKLRYPIAYYTLTRTDGDVVEKIFAPNLNFDDLKTNVQNSNYTYSVSATDLCNSVSPESNVGRSILLKVAPADEDQNAKLTWTPYIYWNEGVQEYKIERSISGGDFMTLGSTDGLQTEFIDKNLPKTCEKDIKYRVTALRAQPLAFDSVHYAESVSNETQYTPEIRFYIPSAFTPNGNNLNEGFKPQGVFFYRYDMKLYNRYGQKIYDNDVCLNAWDGRYMDENAPEGVYAYFITAYDMAGKSYQFSGTVTLLR